METRELFLNYLQKEKEECLAKGERLMLDERKDEANICKVEANIYDIFAVLYQSAIREAEKKNGTEEMVKEKFLASAERIPANWKKSLAAAKEYEDAAKILVEETKLQAVEKIIKEYQRVMED